MAAGTRDRPARTWLLLGSALLLVLFVLHISLGTSSFVSPLEVMQRIVSGPGDSSRETAVVWSLRLPRALTCLLVGGLLGAVGSAFQALFRNPLAEPYVVGVSSGAAIGVVLVQISGLSMAVNGLVGMGAGFVGGLLALGLVMGLARSRGSVDVTTLLLAGVVVGAFFAALLSLALLAAGKDTNRILAWLLGNTADARWPEVAVLAPVAVIGLLLLLGQTRGLNAFAMGEETARRLGLDTGRLKVIVLVVGTAMTAAAVSVGGVIGFLGLVAPHISRSILGTDWRRSLPGAFVAGGSLLLLADVVAERLIPYVTTLWGLTPVVGIPVGIVTAVVGAPTLLVLLRRRTA